MNPVSIVYILLTALNAVYVIATLDWTWRHFGRRDAKGQAVSLRQLRLLIQDRSSELSKRSIFLATISNLGCIVAVLDLFFEMADDLDPSFQYPCEKMSLLTLASWCLVIIGFSLRAFRYRCQLELNRLRRMGIFGSQTSGIAKSMLSLASRRASSMDALTIKKISAETSAATQTKAAFLVVPEGIEPRVQDSVKNSVHTASAGLYNWEDSEENMLNSRRIARLEKISNETFLVKMLIISTLAFVGLEAILGVALGWFKDDYRPTACGNLPRSDILKFLILGIHTFIAGPVLIATFRNSKDAFYLRESVVYSTYPCIPNFIVYFTLFVTFGDEILAHTFDPSFLVILTLVGSFSFSIVAPLVSSYRSEHAQTKNAGDYSFAGMVQVLIHEEHYEMFKNLSSEDFSVENVLFWESFLALMRREFSHLNRLLETSPDLVVSSGNPPAQAFLEAFREEAKHAESFAIAKELATRSSAFAGQKSVEDEHGPARDCYHVPMTLIIANSIIRICNSFLKPDSPLELNIANTEQAVIEKLVSELEKRVERFKNDSSKSIGSESFLTNVFLEFGDLCGSGRVENDKLFISAFMLCEIKSRVLWMLYENIYPRYLRDKLIHASYAKP